MDRVKAALRGIGRSLRKAWDFAFGDDLHEAQMNRGDEHDHRVNPGGGMPPGM